MKASWKKYSLNFKQASGTSRGVLHTKDSYFIILKKNGRKAIGECGLLRGLSADDRPDYEQKLDWLMANIDQPFLELFEGLIEFPSIQFGLEMAFADLESEDHILFPSEFTKGNAVQPINGLIWMGKVDFMNRQIKEKIDQGFSLLKMKIGAINIEEELRVLKSIRSEYTPTELELRVDANGAFSPDEAREVLPRLAELCIHSIEQPIKKGQWQEMAALCETSPVPIALDEELIGLFSSAARQEMMETIRPEYLILKPSFIGGWRGSEEWINLAENFGAGWWATSALESNVGLSAIAQWNFLHQKDLPSGLGTGSLYTNNFESPLYVENGSIGYDANEKWNIPLIA